MPVDAKVAPVVDVMNGGLDCSSVVRASGVKTRRSEVRLLLV